MSGLTAEQFLSLLQAEAKKLSKQISTDRGEWVIKGFIDIFKNIYTISDDTKVISKIIEIMLLPTLAEFASKNKLKLVLAAEQNHYPDMSFVDEAGNKFAVDFKTTYRIDANKVNTMTLGAFTGYFRDRTSSKNITFPYGSYLGHFVLGVIYSRADNRTNEFKTHNLNELKSIPSVIKDFEFFAQPKYRIAKDQPGSGNTKNIGSVNNRTELIAGKGPFTSLGESIFDDYWMYYMTSEMAKSVELKTPPYTNLESYNQYKKTGKKVVSGKPKPKARAKPKAEPTPKAKVNSKTKTKGKKK